MNPVFNNRGVVRELSDVRDYYGVANVTRFPDAFELDMPPVKNQETICSCVAHALATAIEHFDTLETKGYHRMSTGYIYGNRRMSTWKGEGMRIRDALKTCCVYGDVEYDLMPSNVEVPAAIDLFDSYADDIRMYGQLNGIRRYFRLKDKAAIMSCLMNYGPVIFSVTWYKDNYVKDGVLHITGNRKEEDGSHCMLIYGWNENGWKIQNSWGTRWANQGRAILPFDTQIDEAWGVEDKYNDEEAEDIKIVVPFTGSIGKIIAEFLNWLLNLLRRKNVN